MPSGRTNNFPDNGRGLAHVTPTIFGSTVGYPSDSLASCLKFFPNGWEFSINFLRTYYTIISTLEYKFVFKYPKFDKVIPY